MKIYHIPAAPPLYTNTFLLVGENGLAAAVDPAASLLSAFGDAVTI